MTVITFLQLLLAWGFRISGKENPASLANKFAGNPQGNLQKPWKTFRKFKNLHETCETLRKPCRNPCKNDGNPQKLWKPLTKCSETLRKPLGNPAETQENLKETSGNLRKPFGNPAETQGNPYIHPLEIKTFKWRVKTDNKQRRAARPCLVL